jgi:uncharacterized protein YeaO (DUF488 family)
MSTRPTRAKPKPGAKPEPQAKAARRKSETIRIKRVYEEASADDGVRILIDRLWPRGLSKKSLKYDAWPRDLAPSNELRKWYGHDPKRAAEFRRRYRSELTARRDELAELRAGIKGRTATLLTATREVELSHANVLRELLEKNPGK